MIEPVASEINLPGLPQRSFELDCDAGHRHHPVTIALMSPQPMKGASKLTMIDDPLTERLEAATAVANTAETVSIWLRDLVGDFPNRRVQLMDLADTLAAAADYYYEATQRDDMAVGG